MVVTWWIMAILCSETVRHVDTPLTSIWPESWFCDVVTRANISFTSANSSAVAADDDEMLSGGTCSRLLLTAAGCL